MGFFYMFLKKLYFGAMLFCLNNSICLSIDMLQIKRIETPTRIQIDHEKAFSYQRQLKRYAVKIGTSATVLVTMYVAYKASQYFKDIDRKLEKVDKRIVEVEEAMQAELEKNVLNSPVEKKTKGSLSSNVELITTSGPAKRVLNGVRFGAVGAKDFIADLGKSVVESCPTFFSGMILSTFWHQVCSRIVEASRLETLSWYIDEHTQTWTLFDDIALACAPYDLQSELLSLSQIQDKGGVCLNSYVDDLAELVKRHKKSSVGPDFFEYSSSALKDSYEQKSLELTKLQNYAVPNIAKRKRAICEGLKAGLLFQSDEVGRQNLADLVNLLTDQVQKIVTFALMHVDKNRSRLSKEIIVRGEKRVVQMISVMNRYLDQMEVLLNMNNVELESMSVANKGMFTSTYEFEQLFKEQVNILNRYCSLIN